MLKDDLQAPHIPAHALLPTQPGALKILLVEATYVIQGSHIGDWELANKNMAPSKDEDGLHENHSPAWIQVVKPMAYPGTSDLNPGSSREAPIAPGKYAVKDLKRPRVKYSPLGTRH